MLNSRTVYERNSISRYIARIVRNMLALLRRGLGRHANNVKVSMALLVPLLDLMNDLQYPRYFCAASPSDSKESGRVAPDSPLALLMIDMADHPCVSQKRVSQMTFTSCVCSKVWYLSRTMSSVIKYTFDSLDSQGRVSK